MVPMVTATSLFIFSSYRALQSALAVKVTAKCLPVGYIIPEHISWQSTDQENQRANWAVSHLQPQRQLRISTVWCWTGHHRQGHKWGQKLSEVIPKSGPYLYGPETWCHQFIQSWSKSKLWCFQCYACTHSIPFHIPSISPLSIAFHSIPLFHSIPMYWLLIPS